jgi:hypothetical protein
LPDEANGAVLALQVTRDVHHEGLRPENDPIYVHIVHVCIYMYVCKYVYSVNTHKYKYSCQMSFAKYILLAVNGNAKMNEFDLCPGGVV